MNFVPSLFMSIKIQAQKKCLYFLFHPADFSLSSGNHSPYVLVMAQYDKNCKNGCGPYNRAVGVAEDTMLDRETILKAASTPRKMNSGRKNISGE